MKVAVVGLGGCGFNNIISLSKNIDSDIALICLTTEAVKPTYNDKVTYIQIGEATTKGLGAGAKIEVGEQAIFESSDYITESLSGFNVVLVSTGLGGGTGTGGIVHLINILNSLNLLHFTIAVTPFHFEGKKKAAIASEKLKEIIDLGATLLTIDNNKLLSRLNKQTKLTDAFEIANQSLADITCAIISMIKEVGLINIDLADLELILKQPGFGLVVTGIITQTCDIKSLINTAQKLTQDLKIDTGKSAIVIVSAPESLSLEEYDSIGTELRNALHNNASIISGLNYTEAQSDIKVFAFITGLSVKPSL